MNTYSQGAKQNRAGELGNVPGRSERFLADNDQWYFQTREGAVEGPYASRNQASKALGDFLEFLAMATPKINF